MSVVGSTREIIRTAREENVPFLAASIAYYALASVVPLLVVVLAVLSTLGGTDSLLALLRSVLTEQWQHFLEQVLSNTRGHSTAGGLGFLFVVWSGSKVFRGIAVAFGEVYGNATESSFPERIGRSLLVMVLLLGAVILLSVTSIVLTYAEFPVRYPLVVGNLAALVILSLAFVPVYYVLSPVDVSLRHVVPGSLLAALGWLAIQVGFFSYAGRAG